MTFTKSDVAAGVLFGAALLVSGAAFAADLIEGPYDVSSELLDYPAYSARATVINGRTLYYPEYDVTVRLMDIDACELPQWSLDIQIKGKPVPCGAFAKAWLKRQIGNNPIQCFVAAYAPSGQPLAYCFNGPNDLGLEMLRVGWARVATPAAQNPNYVSYQKAAMKARYGMWKTFVLDMNEWRKRSIDKTLSRKPIADYNLLLANKSKILPPFAEYHANKPKRTDQ